jgi:hypothetical protein
MEGFMNKKVLYSLFPLLCAVALIVVGAVPKIEHLVWADTGYDAVFIYELTPSNFRVSLDYKSEPILEFDVPPSLLSSKLFFEWNGSMSYTWTFGTGYDGNIPRHMIGEIIFEFISPLIPTGVIVQGRMTICSVDSYNLNIPTDFGSNTASRYAKHVLRKDHLDAWEVFYAAEPSVPYPGALQLLNKLLKNGFHVQVFAAGTVQCASSVRYIQVACQVIRTAS